MSVKTKLARQAVKTTAKHSAHGAASKFTRQPVRNTTLLTVGVAVGLIVGLLIGRRGGSAQPAPLGHSTSSSATANGAPSGPDVGTKVLS